MKKINFFKMHGAGNDYIFVDARKQAVASPEKLAAKMSRRHFSVGADGLVLITRSETADCGMKIFNSDGSEGLTCGNALRCVAAYLYGKKRTLPKSFTVETASGVREVSVGGKGGEIAVFMGKAAFRAESLPPVGVFVMPFSGREYAFTAVSVGNPHAVAIVEDLSFDVAAVAQELQASGIFPFGVNVEFVTVRDGKINMRVVERGSGETLCCGSGACAAASAVCRHGVLPFGEIEVICPGGKVKVEVGQDFSLILKGDAEFVFKGEYFYE